LRIGFQVVFVQHVAPSLIDHQSETKAGVTFDGHTTAINDRPQRVTEWPAELKTKEGASAGADGYRDLCVRACHCEVGPNAQQPTELGSEDSAGGADEDAEGRGDQRLPDRATGRH